LHSQPKSTVGTPAYIAPEVLTRKEYDGKVRSYSSQLLILGLGHGFIFFYYLDTCGPFCVLFDVFVFSNYVFIASYRLQMFGLVESPYM